MHVPDFMRAWAASGYHRRMNTHSPVRIVIHGASGRMGQSLLRLAAETAGIEVVAAVVRKAPAQRVIDGIPFFASTEMGGLPPFDVLIDFSLPEAFDPVLAQCVQRGVALVSGTTGLSDAQRHALDAAAARIALVWASNFSLGVAVLTDLVERAAAALPGWDCDIVEAHHVHKKDAPSGTALSLGAAAETAGAAPRYASLRAGDIVGEHLASSPGWASGWNWCTGPPTATFSPAVPCTWRRGWPAGRLAATGCATCCEGVGDVRQLRVVLSVRPPWMAADGGGGPLNGAGPGEVAATGTDAPRPVQFPLAC